MQRHTDALPTYLHDPAKHRIVVHSAAIPSSMAELVLAFLNSRLCPLANVLHVILVQVAEFLLSLRESCQLAAQGLGSDNVHLWHLHRIHGVHVVHPKRPVEKSELC